MKKFDRYLKSIKKLGEERNAAVEQGMILAFMLAQRDMALHKIIITSYSTGACLEYAEKALKLTPKLAKKQIAKQRREMAK